MAEQERRDVPVDTTASLDPDLLADGVDPTATAATGGTERRLVITRGPGAGSTFVIDRPEVRIGRHPEADILLDDVTVSRRHALVTSTPDGVVLTDQGSLNGSYVAGERVDSHALSDGDDIQIGRFHLVYRDGPDAADDGSGGA